MAEKWIQKAIKNPGALRATARRMGLIKGDEKLSASDLEALRERAKRSGDTTLLRRVNLALTLRKLRNAEKGYVVEEKARVPEKQVQRYRTKKLPDGTLLTIAVLKKKGPRGGRTVVTAVKKPKVKKAESGYVILSEAYDSLYS